MPIRFRCGYCNKLLGIARRKAGTQTTCPHCGATITVPVPQGPDQTDLDEIDALLNAGGRPQAPPANPSPPPSPRPPASGPQAKSPPGERPLFERDIDSVLGVTNKPANPPPEKPKPVPTSGMDATSLAPATVDPAASQKTTTAVVCVVVLLTAAFVTGFLIALR